MDKTYSRWRAGYQSCEQCCHSAYNQLVQKDKEIEELRKQLEGHKEVAKTDKR